ncbi:MULTISPECIES: tryptophan 2,3-dioxygenase [Bradyrhizobium]|uniref:Tryptophan 2,3-dioxygenase n=3 Tax=Bradyrhizobium TaxID=374 RepID=A0A410VI38_9BRAD|nr:MULTISPECIES: tryptophan 2,3-dioxygenase [Bradyrhizobium]MCG2628287.1 tryptophan 2,3-dioxygenase [Bradyrhizobium zhengyangense]MCG2643406.1 tryptophan 2,3-dioxygenase [Bradyrhizobium zhengyangense]MCG2670279.1 tryptophan 2,3-dioxygenase [Bradyrhizobium zhengyangense]MDN4985986.1 tryptophan 2,3-dioxygenase [Bradyrhizobium sp. WYCCWR 13022]MDN5002634.1 tryptophan 2,3-dioxygenase [Bradyrhizobium sp. WYCCWR 12677]
MANNDYDPTAEGAETNFAARMSYSDYLRLETILSAQHPLSDAHDEMLFIVQHQASELWMRLAIHELGAARDAIARDAVAPAMKMLARVSRIFEQLNSAWDVLRTMTPSEYTHFRAKLGQSSGFQSRQYRLIEYVLGNRNPAMLKPHAHDAEATRLLERELTIPSLYDEVLRLGNRKGLAIPRSVLERDVRETHRLNDAVVEAWRCVYEAPETHWLLYELAEKLVDFEDYFRRWRFNHVTTVERIIGFKRGTGGTGGVSYLKRMLEVELFPELWRVRTVL